MPPKLTPMTRQQEVDAPTEIGFFALKMPVAFLVMRVAYSAVQHDPVSTPGAAA